MLSLCFACTTHVGAPVTYGGDTADTSDEAVSEADEVADEDDGAGTDDDGDGYTEEEGDCDDDDPLVHPGAPEPENGVDDDCDGLVDEPEDGPGGPGDDTDDPFPGDSCGESIPVVTALTAENGGLYDFGSGLSATVMFQVAAEDDDGDLHEHQLHIWTDSSPDGVVDTSGSAPMVAAVSVSTEACEVAEVTVDLRVEVGHSLPAGEEVDVAIAVEDAAGHLSIPMVLTLTTPLEDGSDA